MFISFLPRSQPGLFSDSAEYFYSRDLPDAVFQGPSFISISGINSGSGQHQGYYQE